MALASESGKAARWSLIIVAALPTAAFSFVFLFAIAMTEYQQARTSATPFQRRVGSLLCLQNQPKSKAPCAHALSAFPVATCRFGDYSEPPPKRRMTIPVEIQ